MNHFHIGFFEFLVFGLYLFLWKALILFINIETRRSGWKVPAAVAGLLS